MTATAQILYKQTYTTKADLATRVVPERVLVQVIDDPLNPLVIGDAVLFGTEAEAATFLASHPGKTKQYSSAENGWLVGTLGGLPLTKTSDFGRQLINQPDKRFVQDMLSVPLPYAAFNLIEDQDIWRKAAKFTSTEDTAITAYVKSSTGYVRIMNYDGTLEAVDGVGTAGSSIFVSSKLHPSDRLPKFYAIYPCDASGNLDGR
jgi:hypothetical protein